MRETKTGFGAKAQYAQEGGLEPEDDEEDEGDEEEEDGEIEGDEDDDEESDHNFWYDLLLNIKVSQLPILHIIIKSFVNLNGVSLDLHPVIQCDHDHSCIVRVNSQPSRFFH